MLIIDHTQVVDGIIGGLATVVAFLVKAQYKNTANGAIMAGLAWTLVWYMRKVFGNTYREYNKGQPDNKLEVDMAPGRATFFIAAAIVAVVWAIGMHTHLRDGKNVPFGLLAVVGLVAILGFTRSGG